MIKKEIRIIGIDDGYFEKFKSKYSKVVGVIFRGGEFIDGLISFDVEVDGDDATEKIANAINKSKHKGQIGIIMINGISLAGFNVIDIELLSKLTSLPVIIVSRKKPRLNLIKKTLKKINHEKKIKLIEKAGKPKPFIINDKKIYYQFFNIDEEKVREILKLTIKRGLMPEPLRVAHIIATGITLGENKGRV
ncbi:MAG: DUF99 family protein [Candidatus Pacearchaeota archaeon]